MIPSRWQTALKANSLVTRLLGESQFEELNRFVLLTSPRSGSTWIVDLLNDHPDITCFSEVFAHDYFGRPPRGGNSEIETWDSFATLKLPTLGRKGRLKLYFEYLDGKIFNRKHGSGTVGIKLMYVQAQRGFGIPAYLKSRNAKIIHLIRENHLDVVLSHEAQRVRHFFHASKDSEIAKTQVWLEPHTLLPRLRSRSAMLQQARRDWQAIGLPYHELSYEQMLSNQSKIQDVLQVLGVSSDGELASQLRKINPTDHRELISNFDEVQAVLKDSEFSDLLH